MIFFTKNGRNKGGNLLPIFELADFFLTILTKFMVRIFETLSDYQKIRITFANFTFFFVFLKNKPLRIVFPGLGHNLLSV